MKKGLFITIDGPDGSGKSTHAKMLCSHLSEKGFLTVHTHEPGGTGIAENIRRILLDPDNKLSPAAELFLLEASRAQHVEDIIIPAVSRGKIVVCERFCDATIAYQGYGRGIDVKTIKGMNTVAAKGMVPDITIILDTDVRKSLKKAVAVSKDFKKGVPDRMEKENMAFHQRVRKGFLEIAKSEPGRVKVVEVRREISETQSEIRKRIDKVLEKKK